MEKRQSSCRRVEYHSFRLPGFASAATRSQPWPKVADSLRRDEPLKSCKLNEMPRKTGQSAFLQIFESAESANLSAVTSSGFDLILRRCIVPLFPREKLKHSTYELKSRPSPRF